MVILLRIPVGQCPPRARWPHRDGWLSVEDFLTVFVRVLIPAARG